MLKNKTVVIIILLILVPIAIFSLRSNLGSKSKPKKHPPVKTQQTKKAPAPKAPGASQPGAKPGAAQPGTAKPGAAQSDAAQSEAAQSEAAADYLTPQSTDVLYEGEALEKKRAYLAGQEVEFELFPKITSSPARDQEWKRNPLLKPGEGLGLIEVNSSPFGAEIYIDGEYCGLTNKFLRDVPGGVHTLKLVKDGFEEYIETINITNTDYSFTDMANEPLNLVLTPLKKSGIKNDAERLKLQLQSIAYSGSSAMAVICDISKKGAPVFVVKVGDKFPSKWGEMKVVSVADDYVILEHILTAEVFKVAFAEFSLMEGIETG